MAHIKLDDPNKLLSDAVRAALNDLGAFTPVGAVREYVRRKGIAAGNTEIQTHIDALRGPPAPAKPASVSPPASPLDDAVRELIAQYGSAAIENITTQVRLKRGLPYSRAEVREAVIRLKNDPTVAVNKVMLTKSEEFQLNQWLSGKIAKIRDGGWTVPDTVDRFTATTKIRVTESHVREAAKLFDLTFARVKRKNAGTKRTGPSPWQIKVQFIDARVTELEASLASALSRLGNLESQLGLESKLL